MQENQGFHSLENLGFQNLENQGFLSLENQGFQSLENQGFQSLENQGFGSFVENHGFVSKTMVSKRDLAEILSFLRKPWFSCSNLRFS